MTVSPTPIPVRHGPPRAVLVVGVAFVALAGLGTVLLHGSSATRPVLGSGVMAAETRAVAPFTSVELAGGNSVTIQLGTSQSVVVQADDNLLANVTTKVVDRHLVIATTGSFTALTPMSVALTVPSLDGLALSGAGSVDAVGIRGPALAVSLSGTGLVVVTGTVERLDATLSGTGDLELGGLDAQDVRAMLSGSGRIVVTAHGTLDASIPGTGAIEYSGSPKLTQSVTGTGTISGR